VCANCQGNRARWLAGVARARAAGVTLWQVMLTGPALDDPLLLITDDPERCADGLNAETIPVPKRWPQRPMFIGFSPLPPPSTWSDQDQLTTVLSLPLDQPLTLDQLRAHGVRVRELSLHSVEQGKRPRG
jgi:hypothetical protein